MIMAVAMAANFKIQVVNYELRDRARQTELLMDQMPHVLTGRDSRL